MTFTGATSERASSLRCTIAGTAREIAAAQRVRWRVYGEEEQLLAPAVACGDREIDARDERGTTTHFVVHAEGEPVGTLRLLECERDREGHVECYGLALEAKFRFPALHAPGIVRAEVTRFCVVRRYRGTEAAKLLFLSLYAESRRRGITHWVAGANTGTDFAEDAALMFRVAAQKDLVDPRFHAEVWGVEDSTTPRRRPFYGAEERRLGREGRCEGLAMPRTLSLYANKMGARYVGPPAYDPYFGVFALPLVAPLETP